MQILHPFRGSIHQYVEKLEEICDPDRYRPESCPQCAGRCALRGHGFYSRTVIDVVFDGSIRVRRYLCKFCRRTVSLLPEFALPYLRFSLGVIRSLLLLRLLEGRSLREAGRAAGQAGMPYQRGQFWIRRFRKQAPALCFALASVTAVLPAVDLLRRALQMLGALGWIEAHRFLFTELRMHLLGWPRFLLPHGCRFGFCPARPNP